MRNKAVSAAMTGAAVELIAAPGVGQKIVVHGFMLTVGANASIQVHDSTPTNFTGATYWPAFGGGADRMNFPGEAIWVCGENKALQATGTNGVQLEGYISYDILTA